MTAGQRAYLDYMSWCSAAQYRVAAGYEPTAGDAAHFRKESDERDERDRGEACRRSY